MKKVWFTFITLICMLFLFTSCSNASYGDNFIMKVYPAAVFSFSENIATDDNETFSSAREITDEIIQEQINSSFTAVTEYFSIDSEQPPIKWFDNQDKNWGALYNLNDGTVYVNSSSIISNLETAIVHEFVHYIADNDEVSGLVYHIKVQGKTAVMGLKFNEGVTEYFAQQIKPYNYLENNQDIYYFESYIAKILSTIIGEEQFKDIYINNSYEELKELFNKHLDVSFGIQQDDISLDPFDFFCAQVDSYFNEYNEDIKGLRMNSILEELLIIAKGEGKEKEVKKIITEFSKNFKEHLPDSYKY